MQTLEDLEGKDLQQFFDDANIALNPAITQLREQQMEAVVWAVGREEPYLFINAPTGSGKTLINGVYGTLVGANWTYGVHTKRLQLQVKETYPEIAIAMGRSNYPCWIGEETHGRGDVTAADAVCVAGEDCDHRNMKGSPATEPLCPYYAMLDGIKSKNHRTANYSMFLSLQPLRAHTGVLLADEGHNVEEAVIGHASMHVSDWAVRKFKLPTPPDPLAGLEAWGKWAKTAFGVLSSMKSTPRGTPPDLGRVNLTRTLISLAQLSAKHDGQWLVTSKSNGVEFSPIWGADFVMERLFEHAEPPAHADAFEEAEARRRGVQKVLFTSATLMGAEYIADTLGLPDGSWAYLDLPSTFPVENRPINFAPVTMMNRAKMATEEGRRPMQAAIDKLVERYVLAGKPFGLIHAVSNRYRDQILTESRWYAIMTSDVEVHERKVGAGLPSVIVAANMTEGWDGVDDLCRFIIMPKVPFPSLGDERVKLRKEEDPRSYDHKTLVAVVQGAGRGVRHRTDYADTWILDAAWKFLYRNRLEWLPDAFLDAYHHNVRL